MVVRGVSGQRKVEDPVVRPLHRRNGKGVSPRRSTVEQDGVPFLLDESVLVSNEGGRGRVVGRLSDFAVVPGVPFVPENFVQGRVIRIFVLEDYFHESPEYFYSVSILLCLSLLLSCSFL